MRTHLHRWLPTVIAVLALVIAMGGPAEAKKLINGKLIKAGTISSKQVRDGSLTGADLADGGVTGSDLADDSVGTGDVADGSLTGADLRAGAVTDTKLATASVTSSKLARNSVTGAALEATGSMFINFPTIATHTCNSQAVLVLSGTVTVPDGSLSDDVVLATPDAFFALNFSFSVKTEGSGVAYIKMCNVGNTDADPDASSGGAWRYVAIDAA